MITAIQNSPVNTPKPQYNMAFGDNKSGLLEKAYAKSIESGMRHMVKGDTPMKAPLSNFLGGLPNTFEKFVRWLVDFKG